MNGKPQTAPVAAAEALKVALAQCSQVITPANLPKRGQTLEVALSLYEAFLAGGQFLSALSAIVATAVPGPTIEAALRKAAADLEQGEAILRGMRETLERQKAAEEALRKQETEKASLETRLKGLERLDALKGEVEALRGQVDALEKRLPVAALEEPLQALEQRASRLLTLSEAQLKVVGPTLAAMLMKADETETELHRELVRLREAQQRWQKADEQLQLARGVLQRYLDADRQVAVAVPGTQGAKELLAQAEASLAKADHALADAVVAHQAGIEAKLVSIDFTGVRP